MATDRIVYSESKPALVVKLKVKDGSSIAAGQVLIVFKHQDDKMTNHHHNFRSNVVGVIDRVLVDEGSLLQQHTPLFEYSYCKHPTVMKDMCAECGIDLREIERRKQTAAVAMVHNIPELMVSMEEAQTLGKADEERLLGSRKLVLLVDLDQTLIHTTNDEIPPNIEDVHHFQLHGGNSTWYHTRLRPFTRKFLKKISKMYELHICTFGSRTYAHTIANILDGNGSYFSHRILSRDECFSSHSKTANLRALFPCGDHMVVIIDDREDVWNFAPNLIPVRPYHFFKHTGDINAPPGLSKAEKDDKEGFDFSKLDTDSEGNVQAEPKVDESSNGSNQPNNHEEVNVAHDKVVKDQELVVDGKDQKDVVEEKKKDISDDNNQNDVAGENQKVGTENQEGVTDGNNPDKDTGKKSEVNSSPALDNPGEKAENDSDGTKEEPNDAKPDEAEVEAAKVRVVDEDDYLLYLQEILQKIHQAYYEMYDDNLKKKEAKPVPDMKCVLPYVRRKVLANKRIVFTAMVPNTVQLEKSKPYLVAKSLGACVEDAITDKTTHLVAGKMGTAKVMEAKKTKRVKIVNPDWLWSCAERWDHVHELLFPLKADMPLAQRKPPAHCSSPDMGFQLALAGGSKPDSEMNAPVYDRVTGKRIFQAGKGKSLAARNSSVPIRRFSETLNPLLAFSSKDIEDMDREVDFIMDEDVEDEGEEENEENRRARSVNSSDGQEEDSQDSSGKRRPREDDSDDENGEVNESSSKRKKPSHFSDHNLLIGDVSDTNSPENDSLLNKFRRGEEIPVMEGDWQDDFDDEDSNEPEIDELEPDEEPLDSELCLAGQALEREFLSGEED